jgi:cell division protein FtsB
MVKRPRLRSILTSFALYTMAAMLITYFGINAFTGNHGLKARHELDAQIASLIAERDQARAERKRWQHRVALLKSDGLDPDMLDERARMLLEYVDPRDLVLILRKP